jgi:hypothetical protein
MRQLGPFSEISSWPLRLDLLFMELERMAS